MGRKTLVPEILPTPKPLSGRSLRERVVRHAQRVLKTSAITGTAAIAGCSGIGFADNPDGGSDAGTDAGYTVVDPLPPPCTTYDPAAQATGSATVQNDGTVVVRVLTFAEFPWQLDEPFITDITNASLVGDPRVGSSIHEFMATFRPDSGATTFSFHADLLCHEYATGGETELVFLVTVRLSAPDGVSSDAGGGTAEVSLVPVPKDGG